MGNTRFYFKRVRREKVKVTIRMSRFTKNFKGERRRAFKNENIKKRYRIKRYKIL